jgi:5-enolpyruvylshikimate-3-phosphate synthase
MGEDYITAAGRLKGGEYKSIYPITFPEFDGLLLLAPYFPERTDIYYEKDSSSAAYLTYTTEYMEEFRVRSLVDNDNVQIAGRQKYFTEGRIRPESDWLKAAQFMVFGVIKGRTGIVGFRNDKMVRPEVSILDILRKCDVKINESENGFFVESSFIPPFTIDLSGYACFIPIICVMAAFSEGYCVIKGADRYGDYDALSGFIYELRKADVNIGFTEDGDIVIKGGRVYFGCEFDNYNDVVITAALSIFSACAVTESVISNFGIINRWYPDFIDDMRNMGISIE